MKSLNENAQNEVENLVDKAYESYESGDKNASYKLLEEAWGKYPKPNDYPEAYNVAKYSYEDYLKDENIDEAKIWLNRMIENNNNLHHSDDDCSFAVAKFHFENQSFTESLNLFKEVVKEAGMRYFESCDKKYKDFYLHPEKYIMN